MKSIIAVCLVPLEGKARLLVARVIYLETEQTLFKRSFLTLTRAPRHHLGITSGITFYLVD